MLMMLGGWYESILGPTQLMLMMLGCRANAISPRAGGDGADAGDAPAWIELTQGMLCARRAPLLGNVAAPADAHDVQGFVLYVIAHVSADPVDADDALVSGECKFAAKSD